VPVRHRIGRGAIKLARYVTGRPRFIGFLGGFHGRTMGSLSFTSSKYTQQKGFAPTMPGVTHVPYPNPYRPLFAGDDQGKAVLDCGGIRMLFERNVPPSEVAAILVEPLQGEGGYLVPPDGFLAGLRALCDEHGILLIFDEVQSGVGRTGRMWACEHWGVRPDILTSAKGLGSGLPIGAVVAKRGDHGAVEARRARQHLRRQPADLRSGDRDARPRAVAVRRQRGARRRALHGRLREMMRDYPCIGEVRGKGLMIGMELIENDAGPHAGAQAVRPLVTRGYHNGLLLLTCGTSTVRFMPPLSVSEAEVDEAVGLLRTSLEEAL
jgi:4-aminobutyrate aminotransferase